MASDNKAAGNGNSRMPIVSRPISHGPQFPQKEFEPDDPMELVAVPIPESDMDNVVDDLIMEYLFMGSTPLQVMMMFRSPYYIATHAIYRRKGEAYIKERVRAVSEQWRKGWLNGGSQHG